MTPAGSQQLCWGLLATAMVTAVALYSKEYIQTVLTATQQKKRKNFSGMIKKSFFSTDLWGYWSIVRRMLMLGDTPVSHTLAPAITSVRQTAFWQLVGNTPLIKLHSLSDELGIEVFGKAEFTNPGGSVKDRVAIAIIEDAEKKNQIGTPGDIIFEGTSGSTGISLTMAGRCRGYEVSIFLPSDQAEEKAASLRALGAEVTSLPPCSISNPDHYCKASYTASECSYNGKRRGVYANQFENLANFNAHYHHTANEIWKQTGGRIDGFVASAGTGGTIAGVGSRLTELNENIKIVLGDPQGSALYNKIRHGVLYNPKDAEGHRKRVFIDTIIEGVGINRLTQNFRKGMKAITHAYCVNDLEAVHMSRYLIRKEGLFLGSSSVLNCCALVKAVQSKLFSPGDRVVVMLCDSGVRHLSKFYNSDVLRQNGILPVYLNSKGASPIAAPFENTHPMSKSAYAASQLTPPKSVFDFIDIN